MDETTDGRVRFITTVDIDAPAHAEVSQNAWGRIFCFYVVNHLSGKALGDACESLADIYSWQIEQETPAPQIPEKTRHSVSHVRRVERAPFTFDED